ncbi:MAG: hypothetical protein KJO35_01800, partial [Gammaproteobacteria bacterium]|nr:hypothetical protein [Gammaproteobacteria bacterium]
VHNSSAIMTTANAIPIPDVGTTTLSFNDLFGAELDDKGFVEVSDDNGVTWTEVYQTAGPVFADEAADFATAPLKAKVVDLTPYGGRDILLRFRFFAGESNFLFYSYIGWFVDDISIDTANWSDVAYTSDTSFERSGLGDGTYHYRVRTAIGESERPSPWSNVITTAVDVDETNGGGGNGSGDTNGDLVVTDLVYANKKNGKSGPVSVTATITNFGTESAQPVFHEFILDGTDVMHRRGIPRLGPGGSVQVTMQWNTKHVDDGEYFITSFADSDNEIAESNEEDNMMSIEVGLTGGKAH